MSLAVTVGGAGVASCSGSDGSAASEAASTTTTAGNASTATESSLLFVARGDATVEGDRVSLIAKDQPVSWITDRPERRGGRMHPEAFVGSWSTFGFDDDAPNALLTTADGTVAIELTDPTWDAASHTLGFTARALEGEALPEGALGAAELFIDDARTCQFDWELAEPTYPSSITVDPESSAITVPECNELVDELRSVWDSHHSAWSQAVQTGSEFTVELLGTSWVCQPDQFHSALCDLADATGPAWTAPSMWMGFHWGA